MAIFPQGLAHVDARCHSGERRVLHQLKRCLDDDYLVWHDIPIGPRARQPDFVILSPRWGILLLEVKDWRPGALKGGTRDAIELATPRGPVTTAHPLRQARDYAMELVDLMQRDPALVRGEGLFKGKLLFPYGWGVVLAGCRSSDLASTDFEELFPEHRTLLRDDLGDDVDAGRFQQRLWGMFTLHFPHTLTLPQRDRVRWHLFPEVRLAQQQALTFDDADRPTVELPDLLQVMDLQQEQIARTLGDGHRVIHGVAGSGKTMILVFRAQQLASAARPDRPILVLCYNRALAGRIEASLAARGVDGRVVVVRTFHRWCDDLVRTYQLSVPPGRDADERYRLLADTVSRAVETGFVPGGQYTALLIDEAHDFEDAWLRIAARMVDPDSKSLLVLYDDAQSIYRRRRQRFSFAGVGIEAVGRTHILRLNYRNTAEVLALAMQCAKGLLQPEAGRPDEVQTVAPDSAGRHGPMPVLIVARSERDEAELVAERIAAAHAQGRPLREIAILLRTRSQMAAFDAALGRRALACRSMAAGALQSDEWAVDSVKLVTLHSAKGLEFAQVFVAGLQSMPFGGEAFEDELRLLYVAMTRATHELVLSAHGRSAIVGRVRESLAAVGASFAAAA